MSFFSEIMIQAGFYAIAMALCFFVVGVLQKGFFLNYVRVRLSFGRFILVKMRAKHRDYFRVARISDNFIIFKDLEEKGKNRRISLKGKENPFYRCLNVLWIDIDEEKNTIIIPKTNEEVSGFDAKKSDDLYTRAISRPSVDDKNKKIILWLLIGIGLACIVIAYLTYMNYGMIAQLIQKGAGGVIG